MSSKVAATAAPASAQPAAAGGFPGGMPNIPADFFKYLPKILAVANEAPGFIFGFVATLLYMLLFVGRSGFRLYIAPVCGFHVMVFFVLREVFPLLVEAKAKWTQAQRRKAQRQKFASDIGMQYHNKLD